MNSTDDAGSEDSATPGPPSSLGEPRSGPGGVERRRFSRIPFRSASVSVPTASGVVQTSLLDISLNGALVRRDAEWQVSSGDVAEIRIRLPGADFEIAMRSTAVHVMDDRVGLRCDQIDVESMSHVRRLVELNLGDVEKAERELTQLLHVSAGELLRTPEPKPR